MSLKQLRADIAANADDCNATRNAPIAALRFARNRPRYKCWACRDRGAIEPSLVAAYLGQPTWDGGLYARYQYGNGKDTDGILHGIPCHALETFAAEQYEQLHPDWKSPIAPPKLGRVLQHTAPPALCHCGAIYLSAEEKLAVNIPPDKLQQAYERFPADGLSTPFKPTHCEQISALEDCRVATWWLGRTLQHWALALDEEPVSRAIAGVGGEAASIAAYLSTWGAYCETPQTWADAAIRNDLAVSPAWLAVLHAAIDAIDTLGAVRGKGQKAPDIEARMEAFLRNTTMAA